MERRLEGGRGAVSAERARDEVTGALVDQGKPLVWRRTDPVSREYELRQGDVVFGAMERSPAMSFDAAGECLGRSLEFKLDTGLFRGVRVESARESGGRGPTFRGMFWGWGVITTTQGEELRWRRGFTGLNTHVLTDATGAELMRMRPSFFRLFRTKTKVSLTLMAWGMPDVAEILLLTWFLRVHVERRGKRVFKRGRWRLPSLESRRSLSARWQECARPHVSPTLQPGEI